MGIAPVILLPAIHREVSLVSLPMCVGREPTSEFLYIQSLVKLSMFPIVEGMLAPLRSSPALLLLKSSLVTRELEQVNPVHVVDEAPEHAVIVYVVPLLLLHPLVQLDKKLAEVVVASR